MMCLPYRINCLITSQVWCLSDIINQFYDPDCSYNFNGVSSYSCCTLESVISRDKSCKMLSRSERQLCMSGRVKTKNEK